MNTLLSHLVIEFASAAKNEVIETRKEKDVAKTEVIELRNILEEQKQANSALIIEKDVAKTEVIKLRSILEQQKQALVSLKGWCCIPGPWRPIDGSYVVYSLDNIIQSRPLEDQYSWFINLQKHKQVSFNMAMPNYGASIIKGYNWGRGMLSGCQDPKDNNCAYHMYQGETQEIIVDLNCQRQVNLIRVLPWTKDWGSCTMIAYNIDVSTNQTDWKNVVNEGFHPISSIGWKDHSFVTIETRYIRLKGRGDAQTYVASFTSLEVFGPAFVNHF